MHGEFARDKPKSKLLKCAIDNPAGFDRNGSADVFSDIF